MNPTKPILCLGCFFATAALAQPDVQLYGKVDLAVQYTKNPGKEPLSIYKMKPLAGVSSFVKT